MNERGEYSVENAMRFEWSSMTGDLHPDRVEHLRRHLRGRSVLDVGCGGGAYVDYLAASGWTATGLERSEEFLAVARARSARNAFVQGDITAIPFDDAHFDSVYCYDVIEHVADDLTAVRELCRVARQRVLIAVPALDENVVGHGFTFGHYQDLTHLRTYTRESLGALLHAAGQRRFSIEPELPVDIRGLALAHLIDPTEARRTEDGRSSWSRLKRRTVVGLLRPLLARARFEELHSGWTAVIDIAASPDAAEPVTLRGPTLS